MDRKFTKKEHTDSEIGTIHKSWRGRISVALIYPNTYSVGMSNLGFQTVYRLLNQMPDVVCERAFLQDEKFPKNGEVRSIESNALISNFDIIAFSISFETDFLNMIAVVEKAGLPLQSCARGDPHPLVIAGGVTCFLNPEPVAPFVDCFLIGEAEALLPRFFSFYDPGLDRKSLLERLAANVPGLYAPAFYTPGYNRDGTLRSFDAEAGIPASVKRIIVEDLSGTSTVSAILTPHTTFSQTCLIEVSRGCPHGCRFCGAGFVYRPPRFRPAELLEKNIEAAAVHAQKIGLVGAAVSDLPDVEKLCEIASKKKMKVSFSSLRADALTPELSASLAQSRIKTATIAPDAGSERMRTVINKGITETDILDAAQRIVESGIPNLRLYFMIGLPTETFEDVEAIIVLCRQIKERFLKASRPRKRMGTITVSITPFVPKPFTPFQWAAMETQGELDRKIKHIRGGLKKVSNIRVQAEPPRRALIQAFLSRGDRRVSDLLRLALENQGNWAKTLKASSLDIGFYVTRQRTVEERLPWDFIDTGIKKEFLIQEYERAKAGRTSRPCPMVSCEKCGVCMT